MKKNYNPFKMWGSWIGAGIPILILWLNNIGVIEGQYSWTTIFLIPTLLLSGVGHENIGLFINVILGFSLGWGIHSIIRRLKK